MPQATAADVQTGHLIVFVPTGGRQRRAIRVDSIQQPAVDYRNRYVSVTGRRIRVSDGLPLGGSTTVYLRLTHPVTILG